MVLALRHLAIHQQAQTLDETELLQAAQLVSQQLDVWVSAQTVECFAKGKRVSSHLRRYGTLYVVAFDLDVIVDVDPRLLPLGIDETSAGSGRRAGCSRLSNSDRREPGRLRNGGWFNGRYARVIPERRLSEITRSGKPPPNSKGRTYEPIQSARPWL